jgi:hypothetical protein
MSTRQTRSKRRIVDESNSESSEERVSPPESLKSPAIQQKRKYTKRKPSSSPRKAAAPQTLTRQPPDHSDKAADKAQIIQKATAARDLQRQQDARKEEEEFTRAIQASLLESQQIPVNFEKEEEAADKDLDRILCESLIEARDAEEAPVDHDSNIIAEVFIVFFLYIDIKANIYTITA